MEENDQKDCLQSTIRYCEFRNVAVVMFAIFFFFFFLSLPSKFYGPKYDGFA